VVCSSMVIFVAILKLLRVEMLTHVLWLTDDRQVVMTMGTRVPVHFENQVITASVANLGTLIDAAKIKNRNESVYALVKVVSTEEDQVTHLSVTDCSIVAF
jgi:hypothetical protein